jgi:carbonic anhydrase
VDITYHIDPYEPLVPRKTDTPAEGVNLLQAGHRQYIELCRRVRAASLGNSPASDVMTIPSSPVSRGLSLVQGAAPPQRPFAIVLSCSDARVPVEELFQVCANSVFVVRVAGNSIGSQSLASISYALNQFRDSVRVVVVLGHTSCGAITAAVDCFQRLERADALADNEPLRSLVERLGRPVQMAAEAQLTDENSDQISTRVTLIESGAYINAASTACELRNCLGLAENASVRTMFGVYDLRMGRVQSFPWYQEEADDDNFLADAPSDFSSLRDASARIGKVFRGVRGVNSIGDMPFIGCMAGQGG